ncbi:hypothetical protein RRG08_049136 [Elysia crispata]|uniref:Uncharacterized protein n=1 Tax=Elysia crispata TaxID=231223 RepID=A0AAE0ZYK0_9GAST|nr:hypothetical protein RRG08_049136 [Elysia crispata]
MVIRHSKLDQEAHTDFRDFMVIKTETLWLSNASNTGFRDIMVIQRVKHWLQRRYGYPKSKTLTSETLWLSNASNTGFRDIMVIQRVKHWLQRRYGYPKKFERYPCSKISGLNTRGWRDRLCTASMLHHCDTSGHQWSPVVSRRIACQEIRKNGQT